MFWCNICTPLDSIFWSIRKHCNWMLMKTSSQSLATAMTQVLLVLIITVKLLKVVLTLV